MSHGFLRRIARCLPFAWLLMLATATPTFALQPNTPLSRLGRQGWTMENGLPQNTVPVLLQSKSGFLWAGTELGLARFDGVSFRNFDHANTPAFPDAEIRCLLDDSQDSSLWIGTGDGLVRWLNGQATLFRAQDGLPSNSIRGLVETTDGVVWAWTEAGLARLNRSHAGSRFEPVGGFTSDAINSIAAGTDGTLWIGTAQGAALRRNGHWIQSSSQRSLVQATLDGSVLIANGDGLSLAHGATVQPVLPSSALPADQISFLARLSDGSIAAASKSQVVLAEATGGHFHSIGRFAVSQALPGSRIESFYADRQGMLWIGTNHGLARIVVAQGSAAVQRIPDTDPLARLTILSLLEDQEGDLWVGTESAGLHILRDSRFRTLGASDGLTSDATTAIVEGAHQSLWIGTRDAGLNHLLLAADGTPSVTSLTTKDGLLSNVILSLAAAPNGDLWVGTPDGLSHIAGKQVTSYTSADGLPDDFIRSVLIAPDASLWIGTRRGLTHWRQGRFENYTHADGLGSDLVGALALAPDGSLWIATLKGLTRFDHGKFQNFTTADGLSSDVITALEFGPDGTLWIGTQGDGLNLFNGKQFLPVRNPHFKILSLPAAIHAILDDHTHLWLATGLGLTRVDRDYALSCAGQGLCNQSSPAILSLTTADGLRSRETSSNSHPTASRTSNGSLWFTTPRGVVLIDPLHFPDAPPSPPVAIERVSVDDRDYERGMHSATGPARITAGALRFQFDYASLSFASPQKLRYQYKLEGFDRDWIDAGARRTAYYTNIPPAKYTFRVRAALSEATFADAAAPSTNATETAKKLASYTPQEAEFTFELEPHFYQTYWFRALLVIVLTALVFYIFRRRVIRVEREFGAVMGERNRIAREIHDTLAQGYVGISLQLEILGQLLQLNRTDAAQKHLALTQGMVREGLDDARQSIWALRSQDAAEQTLPIRLRRLVEQAADGELATDLKVHGAFRSLTPESEQEILRIAQEAIHNVKKHAGATRLNVRLDYEERALLLTVADDGRGFASNHAPRHSPSTPSGGGHYGLTGMQERAALIHAEIEILSQPAAGTTVKLKVAAPGSQ